jgi:hypothetical protein
MSVNPPSTDMSPESRAQSGALSLCPAAAPPAPRPALLARVRNYALAVGGLCAVVGAAEGAIVGSILAPHNDPGSMIAAVALDRALLLGVAGAAFGAAVAVVDRYLGSGRKGRSEKP